MKTFAAKPVSADLNKQVTTENHIPEKEKKISDKKGIYINKNKFGIEHNFANLNTYAFVQPKLTINQPNDVYEQEADAMANKIMRMPAESTIMPGTNKELVQRKEAGKLSKLTGSAINQTLQSNGQPMDASTQNFMESRFGHSFENIKIHDNTLANQSAKNINALAYTYGNNIVFGAGQYKPETKTGQHLLAHELTHTIQQNKSGFGLQRRRVPDGGNLNATMPSGGADLTAHSEGLLRIIRQAWDTLNAAQQLQVRTAAATFGIAAPTEALLFTALSTATREQLLRFAGEIRTANPASTLGDPALIDTPARTGTSDAANINILVNNVNNKFDTVASGSRDGDIRDVFGASNLTTAKTKYRNAKLAMNRLKAINKIVTDRSGYNAEVNLGGLTNSSQLAVSSDVIDNPTDNESIITMIHESMHAGNNDIQDFGYLGIIDDNTFKSLPVVVKLTNADHFTIVPRRIMSMAHSFSGDVFTPAGTSGSAGSAPALTPRQQAIRGATEAFRAAWTAGLNLHTLFVRVFRNPGEWNTLDLPTQFGGAASGTKFSNTLPFWSKVEGLTIHNRSSINPAPGNASTNPVTIIDISLSENVIRKLASGMNNVPIDEPAAQTFETAHATPAELVTVGLGSTFERDVLITLILRAAVGSITGTTGRDFQVVNRMAQGSLASNFTDYLQIRTPAAFPF